MKAKSQDLVTDVETLLKEAVFEEAAATVWKVYEQALSQLDNSSISILKQHFDGLPVEDIAKAQGLTKEETEVWLSKTKRVLIEGLRRQSNVRQ